MFFYEPDCLNLNQRARLVYHYPGLSVVSAYKYICEKINSKKGKHVEKTGVIRNKEAIDKIITKLDGVKERINWNQNLLDAPFVIFDSETTGLEPLGGDKIISLSAVVVEKGDIKTEMVFDKLIDPLRYIPPFSTNLTGITNSMVSGKQTLFQALPEFLDFIDNRILVAHYAPFDLAFLNVELGRHAPLRIVNPVIDTCLLAKSVLPGILDHSLESLLKKFAIEIRGRHTALGDSLMTAQLFLRLLELLAVKDIFTLKQLRQFLNSKKAKELFAVLS